jgi:hypothetical protein
MAERIDALRAWARERAVYADDEPDEGGGRALPPAA